MFTGKQVGRRRTAQEESVTPIILCSKGSSGVVGVDGPTPYTSVRGVDTRPVEGRVGGLPVQHPLIPHLEPHRSLSFVRE